MEIRFCECGVPVRHFRIFVGDRYGRPLCSQEAVMGDISARMFFFLDRRTEPTLSCPDDSKEALALVSERLDRLPPEKRALYLAVLHLVARADIPITDQEAWDALPESIKAPVRALSEFRPDCISPREAPGSFGALWDWPSIEGSNIPNVEPCNIYTMLYSQLSARRTLLR